MFNIWAYQPYTLVGPPIYGQVLDPLAAFTSTTVYVCLNSSSILPQFATLIFGYIYFYWKRYPEWVLYAISQMLRQTLWIILILSATKSAVLIQQLVCLFSTGEVQVAYNFEKAWQASWAMHVNLHQKRVGAITQCTTHQPQCTKQITPPLLRCRSTCPSSVFKIWCNLNLPSCEKSY